MLKVDYYIQCQYKYNGYLLNQKTKLVEHFHNDLDKNFLDIVATKINVIKQEIDDYKKGNKKYVDNYDQVWLDLGQHYIFFSTHVMEFLKTFRMDHSDLLNAIIMGIIFECKRTTFEDVTSLHHIPPSLVRIGCWMRGAYVESMPKRKVNLRNNLMTKYKSPIQSRQFKCLIRETVPHTLMWNFKYILNTLEKQVKNFDNYSSNCTI